MATETKALTADDVTRHAEVVRAGVTGALSADDTFSAMGSVSALRDMALLGVQVSALLAALSEAVDYPPTVEKAPDIIRGIYRDLDAAEERVSQADQDASALQARVAELERERDEAREQLEKDRSEGRAIALATIAKAMGVPPESKGLMYFLGRAKALVAAEAERDALRVQAVALSAPPAETKPEGPKMSHGYQDAQRQREEARNWREAVKRYEEGNFRGWDPVRAIRRVLFDGRTK